MMLNSIFKLVQQSHQIVQFIRVALRFTTYKMANYKDHNFDQMKMIPVSFDRQILSGTFEYSLAWLVDNELDLDTFAARYRSDDNGRPAYDPALLLKSVIYAYSRGITSSLNKMLNTVRYRSLGRSAAACRLAWH